LSSEDDENCYYVGKTKNRLYQLAQKFTNKIMVLVTGSKLILNLHQTGSENRRRLLLQRLRPQNLVLRPRINITAWYTSEGHTWAAAVTEKHLARMWRVTK